MKLRVRDAPHILRVVDLVQRNLFCANVLNMPDSAIREDVPLDLQLSEDFLEFREDVLDSGRRACDFQIIDVLGQDGLKNTWLMSET